MSKEKEVEAQETTGKKPDSQTTGQETSTPVAEVADKAKSTIGETGKSVQAQVKDAQEEFSDRNPNWTEKDIPSNES